MMPFHFDGLWFPYFRFSSFVPRLLSGGREKCGLGTRLLFPYFGSALQRFPLALCIPCTSCRQGETAQQEYTRYRCGLGGWSALEAGQLDTERLFFFFLWSTRWKAYTIIRCKLVKTAIYCLILKLYFWRTIEVYNTAWSTAQGACETLSVIIVEIDSEYCDSFLGEHCERKTWYLTNQSEAVHWWQNVLKKKIVLYWLFKF